MSICGVDVPRSVASSLREMTDVIIGSASDVGSNGYVLFGHHNILNMDVALKYYFHGHQNHDEVRHLAEVRHPNVLSVMDARSVGEGWAYFMTPRLAGGSLESILARGRFSLKDGVELIKGVLKGLGCIHRCSRLVHGDIKPQNILVAGDRRPVIADFGSVARIPDGAAWVEAPTNTILYRPPEAFEYGGRIYTFSSDLYQVGVMMYELLGGELPKTDADCLDANQRKRLREIVDAFERSRLVDRAMYSRANGGGLIRVSTLPKYVPDKVITLIKRATHRTYSRRYQTTAEFLVALHRLGTLPEWQLETGGVMLLPNWNGWDYRIVSRSADAACEKRRVGTHRWRKDPLIAPACVEDVLSVWWSRYCKA